MAWLVPAIHTLAAKKDVDARHKAGHDSGVELYLGTARPMLAQPCALRLGALSTVAWLE
jgi:hypothetical protein